MFASLSLHSVEGKLLEEATAPLVEALGEKRHFHLSKFTLYTLSIVLSALYCAVKHNPQTGNLRVLVRTMLELAASLRDETKCER